MAKSAETGHVVPWQVVQNRITILHDSNGLLLVRYRSLSHASCKQQANIFAREEGRMSRLQNKVGRTGSKNMHKQPEQFCPSVLVLCRSIGQYSAVVGRDHREL